MSQWTTVQHRLTFVAQQKADKVVIQPTSSISFLNGIEHHRSTKFNMLNDLFNIQYSRMINYSTVADQKMLNSASLVVKLNFFHIGCFRVCSGGGVRGVGGGEFPLPQALIFYFSNFRVTRHFCPIILLHWSLFPVSFALLFILFPLHFILWPFYCFCCCCCCCFISYFFLFAANFSVFLLISALEQRGGGIFLGWGAREGGRWGGILDSLRPIPNERNFS